MRASHLHSHFVAATYKNNQPASERAAIIAHKRRAKKNEKNAFYYVFHLNP